MRDRIFIVLAAYITILLAWCAVRAISGDATIFVLALNYLAVWIFSPLLIFIPWAILKRNKLGGLLLVIPVGLFVWFYGMIFVPKGSIDDNSNLPFSIMTFNLLESNGDDEAFIQILYANPAEVVALQEVSGSSYAVLSETLMDKYPNHVFHRPVGLAVFSQYPILEYQVHSAQPWSFQGLIIDIEGSPIQLINTHLAKPGLLLFFETRDLGKIKDLAAARAGQITRIMDVIESKNMPAVLACDCNMTNLTGTYSQVTSKLQDAYRTRGWGFGHTFVIPRGFDIKSDINLPFQRIDYLFYSPQLSIQSIRVISKESGSDHKPILAQFDFR